MTISSILNEFIERWYSSKNFYLQIGIFKSVSEGDQLATFEPASGGAEVDVNLTIKGADNSCLIIPKVDSIGMVFFVNDTDAYIMSANKVDKYFINSDEIIFNDGNNDGIVKINELTTKLNKLVSEVKTLKTLLDTHTHTLVTVGAGVSGVPVPIVANFTDFNKADYEDTKIKH